MTTSLSPQKPIGVIGLGLLGTALAERLLGAGYPLVVFNRTREKADPLLEHGAKWSDHPLVDVDRAVICLYTTANVDAVLSQMETDLRPGQILIDATTGDPQQTHALGSRLAEMGVRYLESPIAASSDQTRRGEALAMVAGEQEAYEACQDLFAALAPKSFYLGTWGNAARMKLVNNLILGLNRAALAEGLLFAEAEGLDASAALEVLKAGNSYSVVMDVKGRKMVQRDFAADARLSQHRKDVDMILGEAHRLGMRLPLSATHRELLGICEQSGFGDLDNSVILKAIEAAALDSGEDAPA